MLRIKTDSGGKISDELSKIFLKNLLTGSYVYVIMNMDKTNLIYGTDIIKHLLDVVKGAFYISHNNNFLSSCLRASSLRFSSAN